MNDTTQNLLAPSALLDFGSQNLQQLIAKRGWRGLPRQAAIGQIYDFVRNEVAFGYNRADDIPASTVLRDGFGQCNTKGILLMALLREVGIACRLHGFTIHKSLQRGVVPELVYGIAPDNIVHTWVEVESDAGWVNLEGFILDEAYLNQLQQQFSGQETLSEYAVGTDNLSKPGVAWRGRDTYIQKTGINQDFGVFNTPDAFFAGHVQKLGFVKKAFYQYVVRHWMNARVAKIRGGRMFANQAKLRLSEDN